jgi:hypothetical protein
MALDMMLVWITPRWLLTWPPRLGGGDLQLDMGWMQEEEEEQEEEQEWE